MSNKDQGREVKAMRTMTIASKARGVVATCFGVGLLLLAAGPAQAHHVDGATYSGTYDGGRMGFDVSDDGTQVTHFEVTTDDRVPCADITIVPAMPINDHAFSGPFGPGLSVEGSFSSGRSAHGAFAFNPAPQRRLPASCPSGTIAWRAVVDTTAPKLRLGGSASQAGNRGSVVVEAECPREFCDISAKGRLSVAGDGRFKLKKTSRTSLDGVRLTLEVPGKARRAVREALREGRKVTANVTVTARDHAGNSISKTRTIRLER